MPLVELAAGLFFVESRLGRVMDTFLLVTPPSTACRFETTAKGANQFRNISLRFTLRRCYAKELLVAWPRFLCPDYTTQQQLNGCLGSLR